MKGVSIVLLVCLTSMIILQDVAFVLAETAPISETESKIPIAVMDLNPRGLSADEIRTLSDRLRVELMLTERFDVMTREQMDRLFEEQRLQLSGFCDDETCLVEIGKLIGVRKMVAGSIGKVGRLYSVSVWMVDVETGQMHRPCKADLEGRVEGLQTEVMPALARCLADLPATQKKSVYKRWWFWTAFGGIAAGIAAEMILSPEKKGIIQVDVPWPK
ncbi:MAG: CsgG/HfaB family protein [Candidatus Latescibacterota bacterium]